MADNCQRTMIINFLTFDPQQQQQYTINYVSPTGTSQKWLSSGGYTIPVAGEQFTDSANWASCSITINTGTKGTIFMSSTIGTITLTFDFPWSSGKIKHDVDYEPSGPSGFHVQEGIEWINGQTVSWTIQMVHSQLAGQVKLADRPAAAQSNGAKAAQEA